MNLPQSHIYDLGERACSTCGEEEDCSNCSSCRDPVCFDCLFDSRPPVDGMSFCVDCWWETWGELNTATKRFMLSDQCNFLTDKEKKIIKSAIDK